MKRHVIADRTVIITAAFIYLWSAVNLEHEESHNIEIDAGRCENVVWPFEVAIVGNEGEKGVRIGPNVGRGWCNEAGGSAKYFFYIPAKGNYTIWAYCLWYDECSNAVFAQIDDLSKAVIGNNPLYKQWHWARGFSVNLEKGTHALELSNHSDHIAVQKLFLTNLSHAEPEECAEVFSDIFYDGFDGCDFGNFREWQQVSGDWFVTNTMQSDSLANNLLIGRSKSDAFIIHHDNSWFNYTLDVSVRVPEYEWVYGKVGICFGVRSQHDYYQLHWQKQNRNRQTNMQVVHCTDEKIKTVKEFASSWNNQWHQVRISLLSNEISVKVDDAREQKTLVSKEISGGIGFYLQGEVTAYFDDIHVRTAVTERMGNYHSQIK